MRIAIANVFAFLIPFRVPFCPDNVVQHLLKPTCPGGVNVVPERSRIISWIIGTIRNVHTPEYMTPVQYARHSPHLYVLGMCGDIAFQWNNGYHYGPKRFVVYASLHNRKQVVQRRVGWPPEYQNLQRRMVPYRVRQVHAVVLQGRVGVTIPIATTPETQAHLNTNTRCTGGAIQQPGEVAYGSRVQDMAILRHLLIVIPPSQWMFW